MSTPTTTTILRDKPKFTYCGITVVLSQPSRFDLTQLLTGKAGQYVNDECLRPEHNRMQVDVRIRQDTSEFLPGTRVIILCGEPATHQYLPELKSNTIGQVRGSPYNLNGIICIPTYTPQDCMDIQDWEALHNEYLKDSEEYTNTDKDDVDKDERSEKSRHGRTKRRNWRFWLKQDFKKAIRIAHNNGQVPVVTRPDIVIYPSSQEIIEVLTNTKNSELFFDLETDTELNVQCFAFGFTGHSKVYVVPLLRYNYTHAYNNLHAIMRAFAVAIRDNTSVAHNGKNFDWFVLAYKYRIPVGNSCYDTLIAQHRCYPEVEKSLGHCTSLWTYEQFHKDEGVFMPQNSDQERQLWQYCGKDVVTMMLVKRGIDEYSKRIPGLADSITQAMRCIKPYLTIEFTGIRYDKSKLDAIMQENDRLMMQYIRMAKILVGEELWNSIRGKAKGHLLSSSAQAVKYFHEILGYSVVYRSPKTKLPSLDAKSLLKLRIKYPTNPVLTLVLLYRGVATETGSLKFNPMWSKLGEQIKQYEQPTIPI